MTHSDIYTKFMIEYDKANITSSYPSLTKYEIATILDKAYLALIAQKYTGNNPRRSAFESDMKAIEDLQPLINKLTAVGSLSGDNSYTFATHTIDNLVLYIIDGQIEIKENITSHDNKNHKYENIVFVSHDVAKKFKVTKQIYLGLSSLQDAQRTTMLWYIQIQWMYNIMELSQRLNSHILNVLQNLLLDQDYQ